MKNSMNNLAYSINDCIVYGNSGVCKIIDISKKKFFDVDEKLYYVMQPVFSDQSVIYTPIDQNLDKFRKVLSVNQVREIIKEIPSQETIWVENNKVRNEKFTKILKNGDQKEIAQLIKTFYVKREELKSAGKKLHIADERVMKEAEQVLYEEFAFVLDTDPEQIPEIIEEKINNEVS